MPVYEYECENCHVRFEKMQRFSEEPVRTCPTCQGPVHRVMQPVGVIFKGSGFYVTDNRGKSSTMPPTKREVDGKGDSQAKSEAQSGETAPAAKAKESASAS